MIQETKKIIIEVKNKTSTVNIALNKKADLRAKAAAGDEVAQLKLANTQKAAIGSFALTMGAAIVTQVQKSVDFSISGISMITGNSSLQNQLSRKQELITEGLTIVGAAVAGGAAGAVAGTAFGPIGTVIGLGVGFATGAAIAYVNRDRKYEERRRDYEYDLFKDTTALGVNTVRAGVSVYGNGRLHMF